MLNPERGDASRSDQHFNPKQACHNSIIPYYSTKPVMDKLITNRREINIAREIAFLCSR
ncbi:hypothetical protein [Candidatus Symbiopectobacterium sp.]|uniref:hypothetical protein n=1 Tax=Candidatus Symbiopectobacterium sp. TaxID=2816440 RepID=UPI0025C299C4|nr:hypothetical protein [Candidatus Symbiopectobacterium sp.]